MSDHLRGRLFTAEEQCDLIGAIADAQRIIARQQFLLLTMSPDRVRDQLVREFGGEKSSTGLLLTTAAIVAKPE